jgi:heat shock protein HslJ
VRTRTVTTLTVLALLVTASACGDSDGDSDSSSATSTSTTRAASGGSAALEGADWVLVDVGELAPGASGTVTANFDAGTVTGRSACNQYRAPYEVDGDALTIGPEIAGTAMGCEPGPMAAEQAYQRRLVEVASYAIDGEELTLSDKAGAALLVYRASSGSDLEGAWEVTGFFSGTAIESPRPGPTLTADFTANTVSGNGGCNRFNGAYTTDGDGITIGPLASTLMACADDTLTQQEQRYTAALEAAKTFSVAGDRLELFREDGGIAVTFAKGAAPTG